MAAIHPFKGMATGVKETCYERHKRKLEHAKWQDCISTNMKEVSKMPLGIRGLGLRVRGSRV